MVNLAVDDEGWTRTIMEWIKLQSKDLQMTKSIVGSIVHWQHNSSNVSILDPILSNRKGAPMKL